MDKVLGGFFRRFNNFFQKSSDSYSGGVKRVISRKAARHERVSGVDRHHRSPVQGRSRRLRAPLQDKQYLIGFAQLQEGATLDAPKR